MPDTKINRARGAAVIGSEPQERTLSARVNLYYDLYSPPVTDEIRQTAPPLLIALHGYGANKRYMLREGRTLAPDGFAVAALQGFHQHLKDPRAPGEPLRFGFGWLTNFKPEESVALHHQALRDIIAELTAENTIDANRIFLLGFSQTCALNFRFAFTHPDMLRGVIGICGGIPGDWETNELYQPTNAEVFYLSGTQDEFYTPERVADYGTKLKQRAQSVEVRAYQTGHELTDEMRGDVRDWMTARRK